MFVLDIETSVIVEKANQTRVELLHETDCVFICALMTAEISEDAGKISTYYGRQAAEMACMELHEGVYYTWNGARFDMFFIYHLLRKNGFIRGDKKDLKTGELDYLIANGKILQLTYCTDNGTIEIKDACLLFSCSLASFIKNTCPEKPKLTGAYDYSKYREFESDFSDEDKSYCVSDVEGFAIGLHRVTCEFRDEFGLDILESLTAGSFAMRYAREKIDPSSFVQTGFPRGFVAGGRTYVNRQHVGKIMRDLVKIDANSFYPTAMAKTKLPIGPYIKLNMSSAQLKKYADTYPDEYIFAHLKEGLIEYQDMFSPILALDSQGKRVYPQTATHLDNIYLDDNIIRDPKTWHDGIFEVYIFRGEVGIFAYMNDIFKLKNRYKFEKKFALELALKIILNSTYGKFLQSPIAKEQDFIDGIIQNTGVINEIKGWYLYPPMGAAITANCRYILTQFMNVLQERFIYADTDSLIFYGECPKEIPLGYELGEWKIENGRRGNGDIIKEDGIFFGRKTYAMTKEDKNATEITFCGISHQAIKDKYPTMPTLEKIREDMIKGIVFDVLQANKTQTGVLLLKRAREKKYLGN